MNKPLEALQRQSSPVLSQQQIALLRPFGSVRQTRAGDVLFEVGDAGYDLVVVLSGRTEIVDRSDGLDRVIQITGPGEFSAELGLLTGQTVFAACVVSEPGEVLLIPSAAVHEVIETLPALSDMIVTAFAARRLLLMQAAAGTLTLIGPRNSPGVLRLAEFADRNRLPHRCLPPGDPAAIALLERLGATEKADLWVVVRGQKALANPSNLKVAKVLGLNLMISPPAPVDLVVVGAGPAGLSAAVYGASEGLSTIVVDDVAIGGQAGSSSRIENYLGFPTGISGGDLAFKAEVQAIKFGARITVPRRATRLSDNDGLYTICLDDATELRARSVVIATGARYRRLGLANQEQFEGAGIYYAATQIEARRCRKQEVIVVGGGNSAGQAAMFLAETARRVHLVYRGTDLGRSMSQYLVARLEREPNVRIHLGSQVTALHGEGGLQSVTVNCTSGTEEMLPARAVFAMIGADPCTDWLQGTLDLDERGFVVTGRLPEGSDADQRVSPFQTSLPGVFAVGDVRSGSIKRVASAVGEGSVVVSAVHQYLAASQTVH